MERARDLVSNLPEVYRGTADLQDSFAGCNESGEVWALIKDPTRDETYEYRGSSIDNMERRKIEPGMATGLMSLRAAEGFADITEEDEEGFRGARGRSRRSRRRKKASKSSMSYRGSSRKKNKKKKSKRGSR